MMPPHPGPSAAALRRMNRVLLCLLDRDESLTVREIKASLSEPMSRNDCDSAIKRLLGARQVEKVGDASPALWRATPRGRDVGVMLILRGERY